MKKIIIDGYNVLYNPSFPSIANQNLEEQREHLIALVTSHAQRNAIKTIIVFDNASQQFQHHSSSGKYVKIFFSRPGEEADHVIKEMLRAEKTPSQLTVISSDREICFCAKDHGATCISSKDFCQKLHTRPSQESQSSNPLLSAKYHPDISEDEVQYWKKLFDQDGEDE